MGPLNETRGSKFRIPRKSPFTRGMRPPYEKSHSFVPLRVRIWVMLAANRPNSAANGFARTSTDSTLRPGMSRSESPVDGSFKLALLTSSADCVGRSEEHTSELQPREKL